MKIIKEIRIILLMLIMLITLAPSLSADVDKQTSLPEKTFKSKFLKSYELLKEYGVKGYQKIKAMSSKGYKIVKEKTKASYQVMKKYGTRGYKSLYSYTLKGGQFIKEKTIKGYKKFKNYTRDIDFSKTRRFFKKSAKAIKKATMSLGERLTLLKERTIEWFKKIRSKKAKKRKKDFPTLSTVKEKVEN